MELCEDGRGRTAVSLSYTNLQCRDGSACIFCVHATSAEHASCAANLNCRPITGSFITQCSSVDCCTAVASINACGLPFAAPPAHAPPSQLGHICIKLSMRSPASRDTPQLPLLRHLTVPAALLPGHSTRAARELHFLCASTGVWSEHGRRHTELGVLACCWSSRRISFVPMAAQLLLLTDKWGRTVMLLHVGLSGVYSYSIA